MSVDPKQPGGSRRLASVEAAALRTAVRDTALDKLASVQHINVSEADIERTLAQVDQALGNEVSLDGQLSQAGMTRDDFRLLTRYRLMERALRARDPRLDQSVARLLADDSVRIYAGPCTTDHRYPRCLDAVAP